MQETLVGLIVACAAWAAVARYAPKALRERMRVLPVRLLQAVGLTRVAARLAQRHSRASGCSDGCGSCGGCDSVSKPGPRTSVSPDALRRTARRGSK